VTKKIKEKDEQKQKTFEKMEEFVNSFDEEIAIDIMCVFLLMYAHYKKKPLICEGINGKVELSIIEPLIKDNSH